MSCGGGDGDGDGDGGGYEYHNGDDRGVMVVIMTAVCALIVATVAEGLLELGFVGFEADSLGALTLDPHLLPGREREGDKGG